MCLKHYNSFSLCGCNLLPVEKVGSILPASAGLRREDLYNEEGQPEVTEAIRRLPEEEKNLRTYRILRAIDLTLKHAILPKDQWTKPEEVRGEG